jgi:diguanylate cyclase (GGDEF)-like protein
MAKISILLAEDDRDHQHLLRTVLHGRDDDISVVIAPDRDQLLAEAARASFDCVVIDYNLPPYTAPELIRDLEGLQPDTPLIVISSSEDQRIVVESLRTGVADFVPKEEALRPGALRRRVEEAVENARARKRERRATNRRLRTLQRQANTDPLTGLLNRRAVEEILSEDRRRSDRRRQTAVILIDLDEFKKVNDILGHDAGDLALSAAAAVLKRAAAPSDLVARWGGEEFVVLRQSDSLTQAWIWADDLRRAIQAEVVLASPIGHVTASIGVDAVPTTELTPKVISRADHAMYLAKELGRNRVCTWDMASAVDAAGELQSHAMMTPRARLLTLVERLRGSLGPTQLDHIGDHGRAVKSLAFTIGKQFLTNPSTLAELELAAEFHDIGKLAIPESLLASPNKLSEGERRFIDEHARFGAELLRICGAGDRAVTAVRNHHARFDNPRELIDRALGAPTPASIVSACDAVVTMLSPRPYADVRTVSQALAEIRAERGAQFDPEVVDALHAVKHRAAA